MDNVGSAADGVFEDEKGKISPAPQAKSPLDASVRRDIVMRDPGLPPAQGMYDPDKEHDSCGVGFVANMHNKKSHDLVRMGLEILLNIDHRGATGADPKAGDGCGMLTQIPHDFFVKETAKLGIDLPAPGDYAIGVMFLPKNETARQAIVEIANKTVAAEGFKLLGWRDVPVDPSVLGESVVGSEPFTPASSSLAAARRIPRRSCSNAACISSARRFPTACSARPTRASPAITHRFDVLADDRLQGPSAGRLARAIFPRSPRSDVHDGARAGASALFHEHVSVVAACSPLSLRCP